MPFSKLNQEQAAAASAPLGYNLIIASAGTGKTSAIVGRIAYLLQSGVRPDEILLLTFTNKAAGEMTARLAATFGDKTAQMIMAGTFHAVSYKWLKAIGENIVLKQPAELKTLFKTVYDKHISRAIDRERLLTAAALYDYKSLSENRADDDFGEFLAGKNSAHKSNAPLYEDMFSEFDDLKRQMGFAGFNDLLTGVRRALLNGAESRYREVLVDEYQDTNPLQNKVLEAINPPSLFCVGDYDQSIYAFNGAEIGIIASFEKRYKNARVWTLTKNYRSTSLILSLANRVIANNERIYPKSLEVVKKDAPISPGLLSFNDLYDQYRSIASAIARRRYAGDQTAVLFRNNSSADGIEAMLREIGIPCKRRGGRGFFESREVKALIDLMTLVINPRDILAFIHILEYAPSIGSFAAKEIFDGCVKLGGGNMLNGLLSPPKNAEPVFAKDHGLFTYIESAKKYEKLPNGFSDHPILTYSGINEEGANFIYRLCEVLGVILNQDSPKEQLNAIILSPFFDLIASHLAKQRSINKNKTIDQAKFAEAKERVYVKAQTLKELSSRYQNRERFLNAMVLGSNEMSEGEGVNLLSVHASKGLEFDEVFVIDLMDGRFPNRKLMNQGGAIEEERRLFYVAVTRARESLYLSFAKRDSYKNIDYAPSQFLFEAGLIEKTS